MIIEYQIEHSPLVIHGHPEQVEVDAFVQLAARPSTELQPSQWQGPVNYSLALSPCEWLLRVVGAGPDSVCPYDNTNLFSLRQSFRAATKCDQLHEYIQDDKKWVDV